MKSLIEQLNNLLITMEDSGDDVNYPEYDALSKFEEVMKQYNVDIHVDGQTLRIIVGNTIYSVPLVE